MHRSSTESAAASSRLPGVARSRCCRVALPLVVAVLLVSASGASCPQMVQRYTQPLPKALAPASTLNQVIEVVNANTAKIHSVSSSRASISVPGFPALRANIMFERPQNFRLRGETLLTGPEVDLGSNSELFWFWVRRNQPPALFFCRHDQFQTSAARQILPVEPLWLIQALGVVSFDASEQHQGPFPVGAGRLEIRSTNLNPPGGPERATTRITIIDDSRGIVLEQHIYDRTGQPLASAVLSKHMLDPASGATLPRHVEIRWPPAKFELNIDLADVQVNQLSADSAQLWTKPTYGGFNEIDLASPGVLAAPPGTAGVPTQIPPINVRY
jgi:hypothetical protein